MWFATALSTVLLTAVPLAAQNSGLERKGGEVTAFVGVADGEATFGGSYAKPFNDKILMLGEASYFALGSQSAGLYDVSANAFNFNVGMHYNFFNAFKNNAKFVPYVGGGVGITRASVSSDLPGFAASASDSSFLLNFGGGLRYYVKPTWGIRPELMVFTGNGSYTRLAVGLFYRF